MTHNISTILKINGHPLVLERFGDENQARSAYAYPVAMREQKTPEPLAVLSAKNALDHPYMLQQCAAYMEPRGLLKRTRGNFYPFKIYRSIEGGVFIWMGFSHVYLNGFKSKIRLRFVSPPPTPEIIIHNNKKYHYLDDLKKKKRA